MPPSSSPVAPRWSLPAITTSFLRSGMSTNRSAGSTMPFSGWRYVRRSHDCSPRDGPMPYGSCIPMNRSIRSGITSAMRMRAMPACALITCFSIPRRHSGWQAPASIETYEAGRERAITHPPGWSCGTSDPSRPWRATPTEFNGYGQARASDRKPYRQRRTLAPALLFSVSRKATSQTSSISHGGPAMRSFTTKDGTNIFYKDWGSGKPIVFSHGWPLTADAWDAQMLFLGMRGYRVIAHDRRGHGRSGQTWGGNEMDTYADDVATLFNELDLHGAVFIGHSTGGGEVAHYLGRHGTSRVSKAVLIGAVPPVMLKSDSNPDGLPKKVFDDIRNGVVNDRSQFYRDLAIPFYGYNRPNAKASQGVIESFWLQGMLGGVKPQYDCIKAFSETDFSNDLREIDIPVLILHGDADQIVPIDDSARKSAQLLKKGALKVIPGAPHGMCTTLADQINSELLAFIKD